jgi:hypothetical protein
VAELRRTGQRDRVTWWSYCADHCSGAWTAAGEGRAEGGTYTPQLLTRRLVGAPTPADDR